MEKKILKSMESIPMMSESDRDCLILNDDQADEIYGGKGKWICGGVYNNCVNC